MLTKIKTVLGIADTSKDTLLNMLITLCTADFSAITHTDLDDADENTVVQMVCHRFGLIGSEGIASESYSGASFNYLQDYPDSLYRVIKSFRKVRTL